MGEIERLLTRTSCSNCDHEACESARCLARIAREQHEIVRRQATTFIYDVKMLTAANARMREALDIVAGWTLPLAVGRDGKASIYETEYGSNGARDYMRQIARAALRGAEE